MYLQFVLQMCIKEPFLNFPIPTSVEMKTEIRCIYSLITSWASTFLVTHPSVPKFSYHSWLASTTLCWRKYCFPENGHLNLMVTVLYPRGIITIAVRFLQLISSSSALDDEEALLHGNIDLWSLVSEREETHKPSDFSYTSSESAQAANPMRQELLIQLVLCFSAWQPEHCPVPRWPSARGLQLISVDSLFQACEKASQQEGKEHIGFHPHLSSWATGEGPFISCSFTGGLVLKRSHCLAWPLPTDI